MPRLRPTPKSKLQLGEPEMAICMESFRAGAVAPLVARWQQLPLDHPTVLAYPEFFRGLVRLEGK